MAPASRYSSSKYRFRIALVLFQSRLYREGRIEAFLADKDTKTYGSLDLRKKHGWESIVDEFERFEATKHAPLINRRKAQMEESRRNKGRSGLDKAFDALPNKASNDLEIGWVGSHPKMRRAQEWLLEHPEEPPKQVKMTAADITSPSNGPCPSKVAYTTLVSWLANPKEFQKQMLSKQRDAAVTKGGDAPSDTEGNVADDLDEVERLLKAAGNG